MKILFISNFLNHHQLPLCNSFYAQLGKNFTFIACENIPEERIKLGYQTCFEAPYLVEESSIGTIKKHIDNNDVIIMGSGPEECEQYAIYSKKIVFIYNERIFKHGEWHRFSPLAQYNMKKLYKDVDTSNTYILAASAYTSSDYAAFNCFNDKCYKWGYFPNVSSKDLNTLLSQKKKNSIIWVGRLIGWKHPEHIIEAARVLKNDGYEFEITIIGDGEKRSSLENLINKYNLNNEINILGSLPFEEVRKQMETADIAVISSDFQEGWGAVLNEYMSSACACIGSYQCGSVPFLLQGNNGLIYDHSISHLAILLEKYLSDNAFKKACQEKAFTSINTLWNYETVSKRFIELSTALLQKKELPYYKEGPLSKAEIINNKAAKHFISF